MSFGKTHELHTRRAGRNLGVGVLLAGFVAIVFGLTLAKMNAYGPVEGYDHAPRQSLVDRVSN